MTSFAGSRKILLCSHLPTPFADVRWEDNGWYADAGDYNQHIIQGMRGYNYRHSTRLSLTAPVGKTGSHFGQVGHLSLETQVKVTAL